MADLGPSQPGTPDAGPSGLDGSPVPNITPRRGAFSAEAVLVDPADHAGPKRKAINSVQVRSGLCSQAHETGWACDLWVHQVALTRGQQCCAVGCLLTA